MLAALAQVDDFTPPRLADLGTTAIYTRVVDQQTGEAVFRLPSDWTKREQ
jgi:hypothetical protein